MFSRAILKGRIYVHVRLTDALVVWLL